MKQLINNKNKYVKNILLLLCAAILISACAYSPYDDNYYRSQNSPTHVGSISDHPELIDCEDASDQLLYRIYTGKGYDPIGHAAFTHDKSFMKDNLSELYEKAVEVKADIVTYTVRKVDTLHKKESHKVDLYEYRAIFWQKSEYTPRLGGECRSLTDEEATKYGVNGILVTAILPNGAGFKGDVRVGDIITYVNGQQMASLQIFRDAITKYSGKTVTVTVLRNGQNVDTVVKLDPVM